MLEAKLHEIIDDLRMKNAQLEKALDLACEQLAIVEGYRTMGTEPQLEWKEWFLKEAAHGKR